jgi:hypothetical protein
MLAARVEPKNGPRREQERRVRLSPHSHAAVSSCSKRRMFAEQVELRRIIVTCGRDGLVVTAYLGEVGGLELPGDLHQRVRNESGGFVGDSVFGRMG